VRRYLARRLLIALPTLLALSFLIFVLVSVAPGDPAEELARRRVGAGEPSSAEIEAARQYLNLDRPFFTQYALWLRGAVTGDLGTSFSRGTPVFDEIRQRIGATVELATAAMLLIVVVAVPLGIVAALFHRRWPDQLLRFWALIGASVPTFFMAYLLIILFVRELRVLPVAGRDGLASLIMPAVVVALTPLAIVSRLLRSSLLEVFGEDYLRTARAKGLGRVRTVLGHALRNAAIPVVTYLGTALGTLLEGVVVAEFIFAWPGLGRLTFEAISQRDYPLIQGLVVLAGATYLLINLAVDLTYRLLDPRIRLEAPVERR
jgi:ABC-type dipeptide/oligopeptide/nickel transport system permease component